VGVSRAWIRQSVRRRTCAARQQAACQAEAIQRRLLEDYCEPLSEERINTTT